METKNLALGMIVLLTLAGTAYTIIDLDNTYYCEDKNSVAMCEKLSAVSNNISTRCYYNSTKYFMCSTGWKPLKNFPEIMNNLSIVGIEEKNITEEIIVPIITPIINKTVGNRTFYIVETTPYPNIPSSKIFKCEWKGEI